MEVHFAEKYLDRLESDPAFNAGLPTAAVRAFREMVQLLRASPVEQAFQILRPPGCRQLAGKLGRYSMQLDDSKWLIVETITPARGRPFANMSLEDHRLSGESRA